MTAILIDICWANGNLCSDLNSGAACVSLGACSTMRARDFCTPSMWYLWWMNHVEVSCSSRSRRVCDDAPVKCSSYIIWQQSPGVTQGPDVPRCGRCRLCRPPQHASWTRDPIVNSDAKRHLSIICPLLNWLNYDPFSPSLEKFIIII